MWAGSVGVWVARERRGAVAVWVREGCGWGASAVRAQGTECGWGRVAQVVVLGSSRTLLFFIFWRSFLISWRKGRRVGGEGGGHGSMRAGGGGCSGGGVVCG